MKDRVIIVVEGGLVQVVYSTNSNLNISILDEDVQKDGSPTEEDIEHYNELKKELSDPSIQFSEVY